MRLGWAKSGLAPPTPSPPGQGAKRQQDPCSGQYKDDKQRRTVTISNVQANQPSAECHVMLLEIRVRLHLGRQGQWGGSSKAGAKASADAAENTRQWRWSPRPPRWSSRGWRRGTRARRCSGRCWGTATRTLWPPRRWPWRTASCRPWGAGAGPPSVRRDMGVSSRE